MGKKTKLFTVVYAFLCILVLLATYRSWSLLNEVVKPIIAVLLITFLCVSTGLKGRFHQRLFTGLVFALTGDTLILMEGHGHSYFLYGMIAFSVCHLFYISAFYLDFRSAQELDKKGARVAIFCCAIGCSAFYFYMRPHLGELRLPVLAGTFIMALLTMMASFRNERVNPFSFKLILAGVLFFVLSAVLLAYSHFIKIFPLANLLVAASYMLAQYLIIRGGVERKLIITATPV